MADYTLTATPPLAGYNKTFGNVSLTSPADLALVSIALPLGAEAKALKAIKTAYGADLPEPGKTALSKDGNARLVRLGADQALVVFTHATPDANPVVQAKLKGTAYTTDQTDVWTGLEVSGATSREALQRICPIDIHPAAFAEGDCARTAMEHLGVLIIRTGDDTYLLLSASSSAKSFLHAVETSAQNIM
ncbi:sarcosine oxidase subunit gamma [Roseovarius sp. EL26]|uniref:sarcosine oxidase subunit gamma n=1 Tax=Roseovarius sp. EL26 TaxID=2126672 RepID=UPI000EA27A31|nr:sarcosine oxidase subunit gamma family protein [Roseovarius sp. EL26]